MVTHPVKSKNRGLLESFEELVREERTEHPELLLARYNGVNESEKFKVPQKLPALIYFKKGEAEPKAIVYEGINKLLLKGVKEHQVHESIR